MLDFRTLISLGLHLIKSTPLKQTRLCSFTKFAHTVSSCENITEPLPSDSRRRADRSSLYNGACAPPVTALAAEHQKCGVHPEPLGCRQSLARPPSALPCPRPTPRKANTAAVSVGLWRGGAGRGVRFLQLCALALSSFHFGLPMATAWNCACHVKSYVVSATVIASP